MRRAAFSGFSRASCSQILITCQPSFFSRLLIFLSRLLLPEIFFSQYAVLLEGIRQCLGQACQKQPSIKAAAPKPGNTMSGFPGRPWPILYLYPFRQIRFRIAISGFVSRLLIRDMHQLLCFFVRVSATAIPSQSKSLAGCGAKSKRFFAAAPVYGCRLRLCVAAFDPGHAPASLFFCASVRHSHPQPKQKPSRLRRKKQAVFCCRARIWLPP